MPEMIICWLINCLLFYIHLDPFFSYGNFTISSEGLQSIDLSPIASEQQLVCT